MDSNLLLSVEKNKKKMEWIVTNMPKVELHAHLNGSISDEILSHLKSFSECCDITNHDLPHIDAKGVLIPENTTSSAGMEKQLWSDRSNKCRSLKECWEAFASIHAVITNPQLLYVATVNVIAEFSHDNVNYLELRTGAKKVHDIPSKMNYIEAVVKGIRDAQQKFPIIVKLLISINRGNGEEDALDTVNLATAVVKKYPGIMVGIDVSGDPARGNYSWIVGIMQKLKEAGLKISCHLPEIVNPEEALAFMRFGPERVGHPQFLHPKYGGTEELWKLAKEKRIPAEICISSNLVSGVAESVESHVARIFFEESLPFTISTDDNGVFRTTLSNEYKKFISVTNITPKQLHELCLDSVDFAFASNDEKTYLKNQINNWWKNQAGSVTQT